MLFNSGLDWLTFAGSGEEASHEFAEVWLDEHVIAAEWGAMGYKGFRCTETGLRWGDRVAREGEKQSIVIASGKYANELGGSYEATKAVRCTRVDFQATTFLETPRTDHAEDLYRRLSLSKALKRPIAGRRKLSLIQSDTGQTLYVGSRSGGSKFFRFYDKSAAYDCEPGTCWRQEIQFGRRFSEEAYRRYAAEEFDMRIEYVVSVVHHEFVAAMGESLIDPATVGEVELIPASGEERGTIQGRLKWLKSCVRPAVASLIDVGYRDAVKEAIYGLPAMVDFDR